MKPTTALLVILLCVVSCMLGVHLITSIPDVPVSQFPHNVPWQFWLGSVLTFGGICAMGWVSLREIA